MRLRTVVEGSAEDSLSDDASTTSNDRQLTGDFVVLTVLADDGNPQGEMVEDQASSEVSEDEAVALAVDVADSLLPKPEDDDDDDDDGLPHPADRLMATMNSDKRRNPPFDVGVWERQ